MKRLTLVLLVSLTAPVASAQNRPKVADERAKTEMKRDRESWERLAPRITDMPFADMKMFDMDDMRMKEMALAAEDMVHDMTFDMDLDMLTRQASEMAAKIDAGDLALHTEKLGLEAEQLAFEMSKSFAMLDVMPFDHSTMTLKFRGQDDAFLRALPRDPWKSDDPADSLYRVAREALNRGEYRRAAQLFSDITQKFPKSEYAQDCRYWEAFSRYRLGGTDDLRQALKILDGMDVARMTRASRESAVDIPALRARVQGALAARGDKDSEERLKREAAQNDGCDREEVSVRAEALAALGQMDMQAALPVVKKVLARRDECTVELRRRALYLVGRQADSSAAGIILDVARNDPNAGIRGEAMRWLPRVAGDGAVPQLEELLRTSNDEQTQRAAVYALAAMDSDRGRKAIRTLIERPDASERLRYEAIASLGREREGRGVSAEDVAYLRSLYGKLESARLREAVLMSLSRIDTAENQQFLITVARNENEQPSLRAAATQRLGRMQSVSASDIAKLYAVADARSLREQILYALSQRKEPEAIDKMMEIARKDTDPQIRRTAISLLARSNNERAKKLLQELIDQ
jgi:HEAT repeat protein/TolA-binding protein